MATTLEIRFTHRLDPDECRACAERFARSAEGRYKVSWQWEGDVIRLRGERPPGGGAVLAALTVGPGEVSLRVDVPPLLLPTLPTLEQDLRWALERTFNVTIPPPGGG
jgi:hypothetical protein